MLPGAAQSSDIPSGRRAEDDESRCRMYVLTKSAVGAKISVDCSGVVRSWNIYISCVIVLALLSVS